MNSFLVLSLGWALLACAASLAHDTAPEIGCEEAKITIEEANVPWQGPSSWRAACEGKRWFCSRDDSRVICTEDPRPAPQPEAAQP